MIRRGIRIVGGLSLIVTVAGCPAPPGDDPVATDAPITACENTFPSKAGLLNQERPEPGEALDPRESVLPERLSETGLYLDIENKTVHPAMRYYEPQYQLWSDGADKQRWTYVPECEPIDSSDMDNWQFPVGTRFFKEFSLNGKRLETRLIERIGPGPRDFAYASYQWNDSETEATRVDSAGKSNVAGTPHDIPSKSQCLMCHGTYAYGGGRPSRGLGFSALQLNHSGNGTKLTDLTPILSHPPTALPDFPGSGAERDALGYLHANCGNCHNDSRDGLPQSDLDLWVKADVTSVAETGAYRTAIGKPTMTFADQHVSGRIVKGNAAESAVLYRMEARGNSAQMPPVASEYVDQTGVELVRAWVDSL